MNTKYKNSNTYKISDLDSKNESHPNNIKNNFFLHENSSSYFDNISQKFKSNILNNTLNNNSASKNNRFLEKKSLSYNKSISNINVSIENNSNKPMIHLINGSASLNDLFNPIDIDINIKDKKNLIKNNNIFRKSRNIKSLKNFFSLNDINEFNRAILTNKNIEYYNKDYSRQNPKIMPEKVLNYKNNNLKEIGYNKSISRNRKKLLFLKKSITIK